MASYGRKMLEAALSKNAQPESSRPYSTRSVRPPTAKVDCQDKVKEWLHLSSCCPEEGVLEEMDCGSSSHSEYEPFTSGSESESGEAFPASEKAIPEEEDVPESVVSQEQSEIFPMLQGIRDLPSVGPDRQQSDDVEPLECPPENDALEVTAPSQSQLRKAFAKVKIAGDPKSGSKRNYRKPDYCVFCKGMYVSKISAHYLSVHSKEAKVKDIVSLPIGSKERKRLMILLQNAGNHEHNCEVLRNGCGEITVSRRPTTQETSRPELYLPCTECKAWVFEKSLSLHSKTCPAGKNSDKNFLRNSRMLLSPFLQLDSDEGEIEDIISKMKETSKNPGLRQICMHDVLIREFCRGLVHKLGPLEEQRRKDKDNIRTKVRAVGRLVVRLNEKSNQDLDLSAFLKPTHFRLIVETVRDMGLESPNLSLTLGHYIKQIVQLKQSLALQGEDDEARKDADNFSLLIGAHWNNYVSAVALRRMKLRTLNKAVELPKTTDMVSLKNFLDQEIKKSLSLAKLSPQEWTDTAEVVMVRILLFNKRRVSEVEQLKVSDIRQIQTDSDNEEMLAQMGITERTLAKRMSVVEVRGKSTRGLRKVFVVLSDEMLEACKHLIQTRMYAGIDPSVDYLFARPSGSPLDGCSAMRNVTEKCPGLECPKLIRTRLLRKYLATTIQLLDMTGDELKMVADHMGHSVAVHTDVYRLQSSLLEKTKVARALIALENGNLTKFAGRNLASMPVEELPLPTADREDEEEDDLEPLNVAEESGSEHTGEDAGQPGAAVETLEDVGTVDDRLSMSEKTKKPQGRKRWSLEEETSLCTQFKENIVTKTNPSGMQIRQAQEKCPFLKERSVAVIKTKINNIILGKCKLSVSG